MTSINAIRFNDHAGAMVSDENRHWNSDRMKSLTTEKFRSVVPENIIREQGLSAAYGNTGTSTIGEEFRIAIRKRVEELYGEAVEKVGGIPDSFLSMYDLARTVFETQTTVKHRHLNEQLKGRFGFDTLDFARGFYESDGEHVKIAGKDVIKTVEEMITWKGRAKTTRPVFGNSGILAGFSPEDGFQIFHFSLSLHFWRPVGAPFLALGSGCDMADVAFLNWARRLTPAQRRQGIDPVEGMITAVGAVNAACSNNLGVDGYYKITLINGAAKTPDKVYREVSDHRSRLLAEVVKALSEGLLSRKTVAEIFDGILFSTMTFEKGLDLMWKKAANRSKLDRFLRGY